MKRRVGRYYVRSADGETLSAHEGLAAAEQTALALGEGAHLVDTRAPVYTPMLQCVAGGQLRILGVGGWGAERLSLTQNFLQSIKRKQVAIVHCYLSQGADPNVRDDEGRPAIIWAVASGELDIVRILLLHGADTTVEDPQGETALGLAIKRNACAIEDLLRRR